MFRSSDFPLSRLAAIALTLAVLSLPIAAAGQDAAPSTRAERLAAERDDRAAEVVPPERSAIERALHWYDEQQMVARMLGGWHGFRAAGGSFPAGAGTALGIGYGAGASRRVALDIAGAASTRGYVRGAAAVTIRQIGGAPLDVTLSGQAYEFPQQDFFGLGMDSDVESRSNYRLSNAEAGADLAWRPAAWLTVQGGVSYLRPRTGPGTDNRMPSVEFAVNPAAIPGYGDVFEYVRSAVGLTVDRRDNSRHPHGGGRYLARLADYRELDGGGFWRGDVDVQQYVAIPDRYRTLALRASAVLTGSSDDTVVPFFAQPTLGGASTLRGFREFRFQESQSVAVTAEYRWEAWWALDGALFVDAGTVAAERRALSLRDVEVSYGVGLRLHSNSAFVARLDFAFSREGFIPLLRFDHVF
jgi:hypothetical protein